jgi:hypothetical protein
MKGGVLTMSEKKEICIGIDIGSQLTQVSYFDDKRNEAFSLRLTKTAGIPRIGKDQDDKEIFQIPTVLALDAAHNQWYFGNDALERRGIADIFINDLLTPVMTMDKISSGTFHFTTSEILKVFIHKLMTIVRNSFPLDKIGFVVVAYEEVNERLEDATRKVMADEGIDSGRLMVADHTKAYMYYATCQKPELMSNNIGLLEFRKNRHSDAKVELKLVKLFVNRQKKPFIVTAEPHDLSRDLNSDEFRGQDQAHQITYFTNLCNTNFYSSVITTVYITGSEYAGDYLEPSLKRLVGGRRIFRGENLYTRGAAYAAAISAGIYENHVVIVDNSSVTSNISLRLFTGGSIKECIFVPAGSSWNKTDISFDIIPDKEDELSIVVENVVTHEKKVHLLTLNNIDRRPQRMTRFNLRIRFAGSNDCIITMKDMGFGDIIPSSNMVWERLVKI